jgi:acyl carrier protein
MTTIAKIKSLVATELDIPEEQLNPARPLEELGVDSLSVIELMFKLEDVFHIKFPDERVPLRNLAELAALVDRLLASKALEPVHPGAA